MIGDNIKRGLLGVIVIIFLLLTFIPEGYKLENDIKFQITSYYKYEVCLLNADNQYKKVLIEDEFSIEGIIDYLTCKKNGLPLGYYSPLNEKVKLLNYDLDGKKIILYFNDSYSLDNLDISLKCLKETFLLNNYDLKRINIITNGKVNVIDL